MRSFSLVILLAACSSSSPSTGDDEPVIETTQMICTTSVQDYCAANSCSQTFSLAEQDKRLCPATEMVCGDFSIVMKSGTSTVTNFFYQGGQLVAVELTGAPTRHDCLAGPASFTAQHCASVVGQKTPACVTEDPPPTGW